MASLAIRVGALALRNPVVCASGEHVMTEAGIRAALAQGAAVVVAKSTNESQPARAQLSQADYATYGADWRARDWQGAGDASVLCRSGLQPRAAEEWLGAVAALDRDGAQPFLGDARRSIARRAGRGRTSPRA